MSTAMAPRPPATETAIVAPTGKAPPRLSVVLAAKLSSEPLSGVAVAPAGTVAVWSGGEPGEAVVVSPVGDGLSVLPVAVALAGVDD